MAIFAGILMLALLVFLLWKVRFYSSGYFIFPGLQLMRQQMIKYFGLYLGLKTEQNCPNHRLPLSVFQFCNIRN